MDTPSSEAAASLGARGPRHRPRSDRGPRPRSDRGGGATTPPTPRASTPASPAPAPTAAVAAAAAAAAPSAGGGREGAANRLADADVVALLAQPPEARAPPAHARRRRFLPACPERGWRNATGAFAGQPPERAARREKRLSAAGGRARGLSFSLNMASSCVSAFMARSGYRGGLPRRHPSMLVHSWSGDQLWSAKSSTNARLAWDSLVSFRH